MVIARYLSSSDIDRSIRGASLLMSSEYTDLALVLFPGTVYYIPKGSYLPMLQSQRPASDTMAQSLPSKVQISSAHALSQNGMDTQATSLAVANVQPLM